VDEPIVANVDPDVGVRATQRIEEYEIACAKLLAPDGAQPRGVRLLVGLAG